MPYRVALAKTDPDERGAAAGSHKLGTGAISAQVRSSSTLRLSGRSPYLHTCASTLRRAACPAVNLWHRALLWPYVAGSAPDPLMDGHRGTQTCGCAWTTLRFRARP